MKAGFFFTAVFLLLPAGLYAAGAPQISKQPANATFARSATARFYVSASSPDGGYLTYQWYRSGPFSSQYTNPNSSDKTTITTHNTKIAEAQKSATLTTTTPSTDGYCYYWVEITNHKEGESDASIASNIVCAKIVDKALPDSLMNGDFERWRMPGGKKTTGTGFPSTENTFYAIGNNWIYTGGEADDNIVDDFNGWYTTHLHSKGSADASQIGNIEPKGGVIEVNPSSRVNSNTAGHGNFTAELNADYSSSLYQPVATVPGRIYEWSIDYGSISVSNVATFRIGIVIGAAINEKGDYNTSLGTTDRYSSNAYFPYGEKNATYFNDIIRKIANPYAAPDGVTTVSYNGATYYVYLATIKKNELNAWFPHSGVYTIPAGQGTTVFAFVGMSFDESNTEISGGVSAGNIFDNVVFKSGRPIAGDENVSYTSEVKLSAKTEPGFAYGIMEVSGSTVIAVSGAAEGDVGYAYYDADGAGSSHAEEAIGKDGNGWYKKDDFSAAGVITFTNLEPGKVYRIVGIPAATISPALQVNEKPTEVLDEGYYRDSWIALPHEKVSTKIENDIAYFTAEDALSNMEYALLIDGAGGKLKLAHDWTAWRPGANGEVVFDKLIADTTYYLVTRPLGYNLSYEVAAENYTKKKTPARVGDPTVVYDNNTSTRDRPLVMGGVGSTFRFKTSAKGLKVNGNFPAKGSVSWYSFREDPEVFTNHQYIDVYATQDPGDADRIDSLKVWTTDEDHDGQADRVSTIYLMQPKSRCISSKQTNMDTSFFVAFLPNSAISANNNTSGTTNLFLYATTNAKQSSVSVYDNSNGGALVGSSTTVEQNKVNSVFNTAAPPASLATATGSAYNNTYQSEVTARSFRVRSDSAISLYAYNAAIASSEISCITPESALGDEYIVASYRSTRSQYPEVFMVIATEDNTLVTITPSVDLSGVQGYRQGKSGVPFTVKLNRGSTYLAKALTHSDELTGTHLKSSCPVAVFSGIDDGFLTPLCTSGDHVFEQLLPLRAWGKRYAVVNTSLPSNTYRVVAAYDTTSVTITTHTGSVETQQLNRGQYVERRIISSASEGFAYVESTKPVQVGLFAESQTCLAPPGGNSDPFLVSVGAADRGIFEATFAPIKSYNGTPSRPNGLHYVTVIVDSRYADSTKAELKTGGGLHGKVDLAFKKMGATPYSYAVKQIDYYEDMNYHLSNPYGFTAYAYGYGSYEGYGYLVGAQYGEKIEAASGIQSSYSYCLNQPSDLPACKSGSGTCADSKDKYYWYNTLTDWYNDKALPAPPTINTSVTGIHTYFASRQDPKCNEILYPQQVTVEVVAIPSVVFKDISVCLSDTSSAYGGTPAGGEYVYSGGDNDGEPFNHKAAGEGEYSVRYSYSNAAGCPSEATAKVTVMTHHPTIASLDGYPSICDGEELRLQLEPEEGHAITLHKWYHNDLPIAGATDKMYTVTPVADSYASGRYAVLARDHRGCETIVDTAVTISPRPSKPTIATYDPKAPKAVCPGGSVTLTDTSYYKNPAGCYYQWYKSNVVSNDNKIAGATSRTQLVSDYYSGAQPQLPFIAGVARPIAGHPDYKACWMYDTVSIAVNPQPGKPEIVDGSSIHAYCTGDSVRIRVKPDNTGNADSYRWRLTHGGAERPLSNKGSELYAKEKGYYSVWSQSDYGCESTEHAEVEVKEYGRPTAPTIDGDTSVCPGNTGSAAVLTAFSTASSFQWYFVDKGNLIEATGETGEEYRTASSGSFAVRAYSEYEDAQLKNGKHKCPSVDVSPTHKITIYPVIPPPVVTGNGSAAYGFVCSNTEHSLTAVSLNQEVTTYRWHKNDISSSVTTDTYTDLFAGNEDTATYRAYAIGYPKQCSSELSAPKVVRKRKPAVERIDISKPTLNGKTEICYGQEEVTLTAVTKDVGAGSTYQWYKGDKAIQEADAKLISYTVKGAGNADETNSYHIRIADEYGCALEPSSPVFVSILKVPQQPVVTFSTSTSTSASSVCENSAFTLEASPPGMGTYKWFFGGKELGGASSSTSHPIAEAKKANEGSYRVEVSNTNGCTSTGEGFIEVLLAPPQPVITSATRRACKGESVLLEAFDEKSGYDYESFRWYFDDGGGKKALSGQTAKSIYAGAAGRYTVVGLKGDCASPESAGRSIDILPRPTRPTMSASTPVAHLSWGDSIGVCENEAPTLTGLSPGASRYEWRMAGSSGMYEPVPVGGKSDKYTVAGSGRYAVYAYREHPDAGEGILECPSDSLSVPVKVSLFPMPTRPKILGATDACAGQSVTLRTEKHTENATIAYHQWYKKGLAIPDVTADSCVVSQVEDAYFMVIAVSDCGCRSARSDTAKVRISQPSATIAGDFVREACHGDGASVVLTAEEGPGKVYQWLRDDGDGVVDTIEGASSYQYTVQSGAEKNTVQNAFYQVRVVRDEAGCPSEHPSSPVRVTLYELPGAPAPIAGPPAPVCAGESVTLSVTPANEEQYEWFHKVNGAFVSIGFTSDGSKLLDKAQTSDAGAYQVRVTNNKGCSARSNDIPVVVYPLPQAPTLTPHEAQHLCTGDTTLLAATLSSATDTCLWYFSDGNSDAYQHSGVWLTAKREGAYSAWSKSEHGCRSGESDAVKVFIYRRPDVPSIKPEANPLSVCTNGFTIITGFSPEATLYQWYSVYNNSTHFPITGATDDSLTVDKSGSYAVRAGIGHGSVSCWSSPSVPKEMVLHPQPPQLLLTADKPLQGCLGDEITLTATRASGSSPVALYKWYRDGVQIPGSDSACRVTQSGSYTVVAADSNDCSSSASVPKVITIHSRPTVKLSADTSESCGEKITLSASATLSNGAPVTGGKYWWYENGELIEDNTSSLHVVLPNDDPTAGKQNVYYLHVTDQYGCSSESPSNPVEVSILALPPRPIVAPASVCEGEDTSLTVIPASAGTYRWYKRRGNTFDPIATTYSGVYPVLSAQQSDAGQYAVEAVNRCTSARQTVELGVRQRPSVRIKDTIACENWTTANTVNFAVPAGGSFGCEMGCKDGLLDPSAMQQSSATVTYRYTGANGCSSSDTKTIEIIRLPSTPVVSPQDTVEVCEDSAKVTLRANVEAATGYSYQWRKDGVAIPGAEAKASAYVATRGGSYDVQVCNRNLCWSPDASAPTVVSVIPKPKAPLLAANKLRQGCVDAPITLTATPASGSAPVASYRWYKNGNEIPYITDSVYHATHTQVEEASYKVVAVGYNGCLSASGAPQSFSIHARPRVSLSADASASCGEKITLSASATLGNGSPLTGGKYEWYENDDSIKNASASSPFYVVLPNSDPTVEKRNSYHLYVTDQYGCRSESPSNRVAPVIYALPPHPAVSGVSVCEGSDTSLTVSPADAGMYKWYKLSGRTFDSIGVTYDGAYPVPAAQQSDAGQYAVKIVNAWGCTSAQQAAVLSVRPRPSVSIVDTIACASWTADRTASFATPQGGRFTGDGCENGAFNPSAAGRDNAVVTYRYTAANGCSDYDTKTIDIIRLPSTPVVIPQGTVEVCEDSAKVTLRANVDATPGYAGRYSYQWRKDGVAIPGAEAKAADYVATRGGSYDVLACNRDLCWNPDASAPTVVSVIPKPAAPLLAANKPRLSCVGDLITLTATPASGSARVVSYRWYKNDDEIPYISDSVYRVTPAQAEEASYKVVAVGYNSCLSPAGVPKSFSIHALPSVSLSASASESCGEKITLSAAATLANGAPVSGGRYEWYENGDTLKSATTSVYVVQPNADPAVEKQNSYHLYVTDQYGCRSESPSNRVAPVIYALPPHPAVSGVSVCEGSDTSLTVSPADAGMYKWYKLSGRTFDSIGVTYDGAYPVPAAQQSDAGQYAVKIVNAWGCTSAQQAAVLSVRPRPSVSIVDTIACASWTADRTASFATPQGGRFTGDGCENGAFNPSAAGRDNAVVTYRYTAANGCSDYDTKTIDIIRLPSTPVVIPQGTVEVCEDSAKVTLRANVDATPGYAGRYSYQWRKDGVAIPGAEAKAADYVATRGGSYDVLACNRDLCWNPVPSDSVTVSVIPKPKAPLLAADKSASGCVGDLITLAASPAPGSAPVLSYRWYKNDALLPAAGDSVYPAPHSQVEEASYKAVAVGYNGCLSSASVSRVFTIHALPTVAIDDGVRESCGARITLSATAKSAANEPVTGSRYEWYENNILIANASTSFYAVQPDADLTVEKEALYYVYVTDQNGCKSLSPSNSARVTIHALPPRPEVSPVSVCEGSDTILTVSPAGVGDYRWLKRRGYAFDTIAVTHDASYPVAGAQMSDAGMYAVEIISSWGCTSARQTAEINVRERPIVTIIETRACENWTTDRTVNFAAPKGERGRFICEVGCEDGKFNPSAIYQGNAVLTYEYTGANGCSDYDTKTIEIVRLPTSPIVSPPGPIEVCEDSLTVPLSAYVAAIPGYASSYTYQWRKEGFAIPGEEDAAYVATKPGYYDVLVCNHGLCWNPAPSDSVVISVIPKPEPPLIVAQAPLFCPGNLTEIRVEQAAGGSFQWYKGDSKEMHKIAGEISSTYSAGQAGQYAVQLFGERGCWSPFSNLVTLGEYPLPAQPEIIPSQATLYNGLDYTLLVKTPSAGEAYEWYKNNLATDVLSISYPIYNLNSDDTGRYTVKAVDEHGCYVWSEPYPLAWAETQLFIPNIFTPNGDGINDYLQILGLENFAENKLEILNKRRKVIFSQKNYQNRWSGEGLPNDFYYYVLNLKRMDGTTTLLSGYVHLKR